MGDSVQIGSLVISRAVFDVLSPLIGVIIGGLVTYFTTRAVEDRKWKREIRYEKQKELREGIAVALEWINPLHNALTRASLMSTR